MRLYAQINIFDEIIVDNFAGGGGASTGIELAAGRPVAIAINHDPDAILLHKTNHPYTEHLQASVWDVDPVEVCKGRPVGLAWFSPDCKHFSKAKGAALVDRNIRGLAWIVLRWAGTVRPRVIMLENVEEFQTWGPVRKGKPIKAKAGQTFQKWKQQLIDLGYAVEHRELVAADCGAPTTRKRFVLVARCDGRPIVWPERTHGPADSEEVRSGKLLPWRSAAEIIDWNIPSYSVFATKQEIKERYGVNAVRPLAENTMRRIIRGVDKFTIRSGNPFLVECNHAGGGHLHGTDKPLGTITRKYTMGVCEPLVAPATISNTGGSVGVPASYPIGTVRTAGGQLLTAANIIQYHTEQTENVRANGMGKPLPTVDTSNRYGLAAANLVEYYGNGNPIDVSDPLHTVTAHDREAVVSAHVSEFRGASIGRDVRDPSGTITSRDHEGLVSAHVVKFKGKNLGQSPAAPLQTITASMGTKRACGGGVFSVAETKIVRYAPGVNLGYWPEIRDLLNQHCGYSLAEDEVILLVIGGVAYYISDITMRMLTPRELYNAMGFPPDYVIDRDYMGNEYKKTAQVARCGNAVCPPLAEAMVRANMPEWCGRKFNTMEELEGAIAV